MTPSMQGAWSVFRAEAGSTTTGPSWRDHRLADLYLAGLGIEATAGLGVTYRGLHASDERIHLASIPVIQATYHDTVLTLLGGTAVDRTEAPLPGSTGPSPIGA